MPPTESSSRNNRPALRALAELESRAGSAIKADLLVDHAFPQQAAFVLDAEPFVAALCPRRAGKSNAAARRLYRKALAGPERKCLYIALTRRSARDILWQTLKQLARRLKLGLTPEDFNETDLRVTLKNNSTITLVGSDASPADMQKFLGQAYDEVGIDEAASFRQNIEQMVYEVLRPAMLDRGGQIFLIGTPGPIKRGLFYRVTTGSTDERDAKWSVHRWSSLDNPYMRRQILAELADIDRDRPQFRETPAFAMYFLGEWALDSDNLVYRYERVRNSYVTLPTGAYSYVMGVDLGFNDDTSFVVGAYNRQDPTLYVIEALKQPGMDFTATANTIRALQEKYGVDFIIVDGANKQGVEEMRKRHDLTLETADKRGKAEYIDLMNADLIQGRVKLSEACEPILDEIVSLVWDRRAMERSGKRVEHPDCPNHALDALLYAWRYCYSYLGKPDPVKAAWGSAKWYAEEAERMHEAALEQVRRSAAQEKNELFPGGEHDVLPAL
jgi:hypothetical protein